MPIVKHRRISEELYEHLIAKYVPNYYDIDGHNYPLEPTGGFIQVTKINIVKSKKMVYRPSDYAPAVILPGEELGEGDDYDESYEIKAI